MRTPTARPTAKTTVTSRRRPRQEPRRRLWLYAAGVVLVCLIGLGLWWLLHKPPAPPPPPPTPVSAEAAKSGDVPIYLTGLGTVQAYNTVTVHVRVAGTLDKVTFTEGQDVKAGDLLGQIDPRPYQATYEQAVAAKAHDQALLADARLDLARYQKLVAEDSISSQQRDTQAALVKQDEAQVQNDQAQIDGAAVQVAYTTITSPIAGRTGVRMIDAGNIVNTTDTNGLVVVTQLEPISVIFTLPEDDFDEVNQQMALGTLTVAAANRADQKTLGQGNLLLINNQIDQTTGTIQLKATFPNKDHALWPGQFVDTKLLLETLHNAITVPSAAVQRGQQGTFVYVIKSDNTVDIRPVKVSADNTGGPTTVIQTGLNAGEQVVTDGQLKLHPGTTVKVGQPGQPPGQQQPPQQQPQPAPASK